VGVEANLHLLRRDPARESHDRGVARQTEPGLLLELAARRGGRVGVLRVHRAAGEDPRPAHELLLGVALHEQDLGTAAGVPHDDQ
jgi:hypothetical protein